MQSFALTLAGGFALGLASTLHCAGMCGSIAAGLLHLGAPRNAAEGIRLVALTHAGRIVSYVLAGTLVGALGAPAIGWLDREIAFRFIQWAGAAALMWIGLSTAGLLPPISAMDRMMAPMANRLARLASPLLGRGATALAGGLTWGLMPCAMVYGALFTAMLSGSALGGGTVMAAFGLGTLPGLLATTVGIRTLVAAARRRALRVAAGLAIAILGFLTVWLPQGRNDAICAPSANATLTQIKIGS